MSTPEFLERFRGKTSSVTKQGMQSIIGHAGNPVDKRGWKEYLSSAQNLDNENREKMIQRELKNIKKLEKRILPRLSKAPSNPENSRVMKEFPKRSRKDIEKLKKMADSQIVSQSWASTNSSLKPVFANRYSNTPTNLPASMFFNTPHSKNKQAQKIAYQLRRLGGGSPPLISTKYSNGRLGNTFQSRLMIKKPVRSLKRQNSLYTLPQRSAIFERPVPTTPKSMSLRNSLTQNAHSLLIKSSPSINQRRSKFIRLPLLGSTGRGSYSTYKASRKLNYLPGNNQRSSLARRTKGQFDQEHSGHLNQHIQWEDPLYRSIRRSGHYLSDQTSGWLPFTL